jgi:hypothetical protein
MRGLEWIHKFIDDAETFDAIGMDGFYIYHELSLTSVNREIRQRAKALALNYARRIYDSLNKKASLDAHDAIKAWDLLAEVNLLGLKPEPLLSKARHALRLLNVEGSILGIHRTTLKEADEAQLYDILMDAYAIEKAAAIFPNEAWPKFGLGQVMQFIRREKKLRSPASEAFEDDAFLATHAAYVLTNYGRLHLQADSPVVSTLRGHSPVVSTLRGDSSVVSTLRSESPVVSKLSGESSEWITSYLRKHFHAVLKNEDIELVAEFIDVFRSLGQDEKTDPMIRKGTEFLLRTQHSDGSWGDWKGADSYYDAMHITWCAVMGLRRRSFMKGTPYEKRIRGVSETLK